jgi:hypothetical protein
VSEQGACAREHEHENEDERAREGRAIDEKHIARVRVGHGANCSSIGSVIDTLFATATAGAAVFAAIVAALKREDVRVVGGAGEAGGAGAAGGAPMAASAPDPRRSGEREGV